MVAFHWLSCDSLSLAEVSPNQEKSFLLLLVVVVATLPARDARSLY